MNKTRHLEEEKTLQDELSIVLSDLGFNSNLTPIQWIFQMYEIVPAQDRTGTRYVLRPLIGMFYYEKKNQPL